jgi:SAM-dependent methyltransferase
VSQSSVPTTFSVEVGGRDLLASIPWSIVNSPTRLAALYEPFCPWEERDDLAFYLELVMRADAVFDVGCGTGTQLHRARESGHRGRLCGLDPALGMLEQAQARGDVEWVLGDLTSVTWKREFDLVVMSGHAFQVFVDDSDLRASLGAIRAALTDEGRFAFETRNPLVREWERWTPQHTVEATDATGAPVWMAHEVETPVAGDVVRVTVTYTSPGWDRPEVSHSTLRFLDAATLQAFLAGAGLVVEQQFGDWTLAPLTGTSPEIITIARQG